MINDVAVAAYLHVEMYDVLGMNELGRLADLPHDADARFLRQQKVFADRAVEQLATVYTAALTTITMTTCYVLCYAMVRISSSSSSSFITQEAAHKIHTHKKTNIKSIL